jgi:formylglycine-generating enzyme required for sulfatase activity
MRCGEMNKRAGRGPRSIRLELGKHRPNGQGRVPARSDVEPKFALKGHSARETDRLGSKIEVRQTRGYASKEEGDAKHGLGHARQLLAASRAEVDPAVTRSIWTMPIIKWAVVGMLLGSVSVWAVNVLRPRPPTLIDDGEVSASVTDPAAASAANAMVADPRRPAEVKEIAAQCINCAATSELPKRLTNEAELLSSKGVNPIEPKEAFKDCSKCPEMVVVPAGKFTMGSPDSEQGHNPDESPQHGVTFAAPFAVGRFSVTFEEWDTCVSEGGCNGYKPPDQAWGRGRRPVTNVSWDDAKAYVAWLSEKTGRRYRLLSEAEREYVTRAGTKSAFWWGSSISTNQANFDGELTYGEGTTGEFLGKTVVVDAFSPNPWGLYQVHGNLYDWVEDCYHDNYRGAPSDRAAWTSEDCVAHVARGGSWLDDLRSLRSAYRLHLPAAVRFRNLGFRVGRALTP